MEDKVPTAASSPTADVESAAAQSQKLRRRKHLRIAAIVALVIVFDVIVITALDLTVLKIRRPSYRLSRVDIADLVANNSTNSTSFAIDFDAQITFRNRNLGPYESQSGHLTFSYRGSDVGEAVVERSSVKMYSSKSVNVKVKTSSRSVGERSNLQRDIAGGRMMLKVESELRGQVGLLKVLKKDRSVKLSCSFAVDLAHKLVQDLNCD